MKKMGMDFIEAVQAAKDGHKVRRKAWQWAPMAHCYCPDRQDFRFDSHGTPYSDFGANTDCFLADDWEIVPEPPKTMTFQEAVEHIEAGKCVRRLAWRKDLHARLSKDRPIVGIFGDSVIGGSFTPDDYKATDWIVVEEEENQ